MPGALSFLQEEALLTLRAGHRFGVGGCTQRGLVIRGLVVVTPMVAQNGRRWMLPELTVEGARVAAELDAQRKRAAGLRRARGRLGVIDGGVA